MSLKMESVLLLLSTAPLLVTSSWSGWGGNGVNNAIYGNNLDRDWMYSAQGISISVKGCLWSFMMDHDDENANCMEESSEDGTTYWYFMSNCRRPQVVFSVYASDSSSSPGCNSGNFKESFVTKTSVLDFVDYMEAAGVYSFQSLYDDYAHEYPMCGGNGNGDNYGLSCKSDGSFILETFNDYYCLERTGDQYDQLRTFNSDMNSLSCINIYSAANNNYNGNDDANAADTSDLLQYVMDVSVSCSATDSALCSDSDAASDRASYVGRASSAFFNPSSGSGQSWFTKLKYVTGGLLLLASFVMFTGILFTNRRRRRALMQRKYRQAKRSGRTSSDNRSRRSSRSVSKHRGDSSRKSSSRTRRSKSRDIHRDRDSPKRSSQSRNNSESNMAESEGIMT